MDTQKLIVLYGFASSGKTTLSKMFIEEHPLSLSIEGDQIIGMMGQWRKHETEARRLVFKHTISIIKNQLQAGYHVLIPYLLTEVKDAEMFENVAKEFNTSFYEVYLNIEKDEAISRLLTRGCWGEAGSPKLTENDMGEILDLYSSMEKAMCDRKNIVSIQNEEGKIEETYKLFKETIS